MIKHYKKRNPDAVDPERLFQDVGLSFVNGFRDARIIINQVIEDLDNLSGEEDAVLFDLIAIRNFTYEEAGKLEFSLLSFGGGMRF